MSFPTFPQGCALALATLVVGTAADLTRPHLAPAEVSVDAWLRYKRRVFRDQVEWEIELRVQNLNTNARNLIPVQSTRDEAYRVAVWRVGPPQVWRLSNSFKF